LQLAAASTRLQERLSPLYPDIAAQVLHAIRIEQCLRLSDFILRRRVLGFSPDQGLSAVQKITSLMAEELQWSPARQAAEVEAYQAQINRTQAFRQTKNS